MNQIKTHVKKGDLVKVIAGAHKGIQGVILEVNRKTSRVAVEGVAKIKRTMKPTQEKPDGGFNEIERPIHISNVKKVDAEAKPKAAKKAAKKKTVEKKKSVEKKN